MRTEGVTDSHVSLHCERQYSQHRRVASRLEQGVPEVAECFPQSPWIRLPDRVEFRGETWEQKYDQTVFTFDLSHLEIVKLSATRNFNILRADIKNALICCPFWGQSDAVWSQTYHPCL